MCMHYIFKQTDLNYQLWPHQIGGLKLLRVYKGNYFRPCYWEKIFCFSFLHVFSQFPCRMLGYKIRSVNFVLHSSIMMWKVSHFQGENFPPKLNTSPMELLFFRWYKPHLSKETRKKDVDYKIKSWHQKKSKYNQSYT